MFRGGGDRRAKTQPAVPFDRDGGFCRFSAIEPPCRSVLKVVSANAGKWKHIYFPRILLAAACFARSSPRFYQWLVEHPRLGPWIRDYLDGNGIPLKGKVYAIGLMWASILFSCYLVPLPWARGFMLTSAVLVTVYILRQKTLRKS